MALAGRYIFGSHPRRTTARIAALAIVAFVTFKWILIPVRADGISMLPTYESGSFTLVSRLAYSFSPPSRGDIVALRLAGPHVLYIKRIIGLPGERVSIDRGMVSIDGRPLAEPYVRHRAPWHVPEVRLGPDEYYLIGDNRGMPQDEHDFGRAPRDRIIGKALF
ncbi:MAG TPA: signal peptidase I [Gemmatimonadaceae bacterium]